MDVNEKLDLILGKLALIEAMINRLESRVFTLPYPNYGPVQPSLPPFDFNKIYCTTAEKGVTFLENNMEIRQASKQFSNVVDFTGTLSNESE